MGKTINVSGVGCSLIDRIFNPVSFISEDFVKYKSVIPGDGGLTPGQLVFSDDLERFANNSLELILKEIVGDRASREISLGGPGIVPMIHAAQMSFHLNGRYSFYGNISSDSLGKKLKAFIAKTPLRHIELNHSSKPTPRTEVLVDPDFEEGAGERIFINDIGSSWDIHPDDIDESFYMADIVVLGGTALVPNIHDELDRLLIKSKSHNCLTVVNTVYDFRNEQKSSFAQWPLGTSQETYKYIDLLIMDFEEALRLSGKNHIDDAFSFFVNSHTKAFIITNGKHNIKIYSSGEAFSEKSIIEMPSSAFVISSNEKMKSGDTTGCGDNFVGGVIYSIVDQLTNGADLPDIKEAACWGVVSGGFTTFYHGGTYFEKESGEKYEKIKELYSLYKKQISAE